LNENINEDLDENINEGSNDADSSDDSMAERKTALWIKRVQHKKPDLININNLTLKRLQYSDEEVERFKASNNQKTLCTGYRDLTGREVSCPASVMIRYDNARVLDRSIQLTTYSLAKGAIMHNKCDICMLADRQNRIHREKKFEVDGNTLCKHKRCDQPATDKFCILHQPASPGKKFPQIVVDAVENIKKNGIAHTQQGLEQFMAKMRSDSRKMRLAMYLTNRG